MLRWFDLYAKYTYIMYFMNNEMWDRGPFLKGGTGNAIFGGHPDITGSQGLLGSTLEYKNHQKSELRGWSMCRQGLLCPISLRACDSWRAPCHTSKQSECQRQNTPAQTSLHVSLEIIIPGWRIPHHSFWLNLSNTKQNHHIKATFFKTFRLVLTLLSKNFVTVG